MDREPEVPRVTSDDMSELSEGLHQFITAAHGLFTAVVESDPQSLPPGVMLAAIKFLSADMAIGTIAGRVRDRDRKAFDDFTRGLEDEKER